MQYEYETIEKAIKACIVPDCAKCPLSVKENQKHVRCKGLLPIVLDYIHSLKLDNDSLNEILDIFNSRSYRAKFISEVWEKEMGHTLSTPDADFIYKLYFDLRDAQTKTAQNIYDWLIQQKKLCVDDYTSGYMDALVDALKYIGATYNLND